MQEKEKDLQKFSITNEQKLEQYRQAVKLLAKYSCDIPFPNGTIQHAAIVVSTIIENSKNRIVLYANHLKGDVFSHEDLYSKLEDFILRGGIAEFIIDDLATLNPRFSELCKKYSSGIKIKQASEKFRSRFKSAMTGVKYFIIGDKSMSRLEYDNQARKALCNLGNKKIVSKINSVLESC